MSTDGDKARWEDLALPRSVTSATRPFSYISFSQFSLMRTTRFAITRRFGLIRLIRLQAREADRVAFWGSAVNRALSLPKDPFFLRGISQTKLLVFKHRIQLIWDLLHLWKYRFIFAFSRANGFSTLRGLIIPHSLRVFYIRYIRCIFISSNH